MFRIRLKVLSLLLLILAAASLPSSGQTATTRTMGTRRNGEGLHNFGEVTPNLYRGALPTPTGLKTLKDMGIAIVVDMRSGQNTYEQSAVQKLGMQYVAIPWHCPFPSDDPLVKFLKVIEQNPGKKVFVHCRLGDDRTGMAIASYRIAEEGWTADEAMKEMEGFGFTGVHHVMCPALAHFEHDFPEHVKSNPAFKELQATKK